MSIFYRLESKTEGGYGNVNKGAYRDSIYPIMDDVEEEQIHYIHKYCDVECSYSDHPPPQSDVLLKGIWRDIQNEADWIFGFRSIQQYQDWFNPSKWQVVGGVDVRDILRLGRYAVEEGYIYYGDKQIVADASKCVLMDSLDVY